MLIKSGWRRPLAFSITAHILLLAGAGCGLGSLPTAEKPGEIVVEIELAASPPNGDGQTEVHPDQAPPPTAATTANQTSQSAFEQQAVTSSIAPNALSAAKTGNLSSTGYEPAVVATAVTNQISAGKTIHPPRLLRRVDPTYPDSAREQGWRGMVTVAIEVLSTGQTGKITVHRSSGYAVLDKAAVAAVRQWRFAAAKDARTGLPVSCIIQMEVGFSLND